jgi:tRNA(adenine34) deaminase
MFINELCSSDDFYYMNIAFEFAKKALDLDEVPVGAIIVFDNKIIASQFNKKEHDHLVTSHAELIAINQASNYLNNWRLNNCKMYVTLEPCPMCAGAIIQSRIQKIFYGAKNPNYGSFESVLRLQDYYPDSKNIEISGGIMEAEISEMLKNFFRNKLNKK